MPLNHPPGTGQRARAGASLGRLEARIALNRLLARFPVLEGVDEAPRWRRFVNLRGLEALNLRALASLNPIGTWNLAIREPAATLGYSGRGPLGDVD